MGGGEEEKAASSEEVVDLTLDSDDEDAAPRAQGELEEGNARDEKDESAHSEEASDEDEEEDDEEEDYAGNEEEEEGDDCEEDDLEDDDEGDWLDDEGDTQDEDDQEGYPEDEADERSHADEAMTKTATESADKEYKFFHAAPTRCLRERQERPREGPSENEMRDDEEEESEDCLQSQEETPFIETVCGTGACLVGGNALVSQTDSEEESERARPGEPKVDGDAGDAEFDPESLPQEPSPIKDLGVKDEHAGGALPEQRKNESGASPLSRLEEANQYLLSFPQRRPSLSSRMGERRPSLDPKCFDVSYTPLVVNPALVPAVSEEPARLPDSHDLMAFLDEPPPKGWDSEPLNKAKLNVESTPEDAFWRPLPGERQEAAPRYLVMTPKPRSRDEADGRPPKRRRIDIPSSQATPASADTSPSRREEKPTEPADTRPKKRAKSTEAEPEASAEADTRAAKRHRRDDKEERLRDRIDRKLHGASSRKASEFECRLTCLSRGQLLDLVVDLTSQFPETRQMVEDAVRHRSLET
ncbi:hypothetical protein BESB_034700 [Besnoitia besnoiti]|uniref:Uncharacterized protein n=1 Tax=Besnoitia besnoiti TaxID=94643 RepID=A0A2A9MN31_BESBE|nr:hypothetical protein BESB_034700 [Besnoitia besnoiti]PFH37012.1 hypothetical protein BESB_034700 [Besnoitia besnoiti]